MGLSEITLPDRRRSKRPDASPDRYLILRRNFIVLMLLLTIVPLTFMVLINHHQYQASLKNEIITPIQALVSKTRHSFELYLEERLSTIRFIASTYSLEELSDADTLNRIFSTLKTEFGGFVDLGLIGLNGIQISYAGPYTNLLGKDYSVQGWFHEVAVRGTYISDVFMGYRKSPHIAIAVQHAEGSGRGWIMRATIDTLKFDTLIASMELDPNSDAFLVNRQGVLQTNSRFYGKILEPCPFPIEQSASPANAVERQDHLGKEVIMAHTHLSKPDYTLVMVKPRAVVLKSWFALKNEIFLIYIFSVIAIILAVVKLSGDLVRNIREADEKRESAFRELEHSQKLSSIGRLAAGVAHEINNPLAIINEKAGLINDLLSCSKQRLPLADRLTGLADGIVHSVARCRTITHRLLGFARRLEAHVEKLDLNDIVSEVLGFLEKEAMFRKIDIRQHLSENLMPISSDRGQLHQVFLNILTNAFAAVEDGGQVIISTWQEGPETVAASIRDNGCGMSPETLRQIFEPFFTTKKAYGTGLGLPITYGIVKKLGGQLKVESKEGAGTTFYLYLHEHVEPAPAAPPLAEKGKPDPR